MNRASLFLTPALLVVAFSAAAACDRTPLPPPTAQAPHRVLFVGNSFLHGHVPPVLHYNAARVTDLNGSGYGGVPGVFKQLADDAGVAVDVASELVSGQTLQFHADEKRSLIASRPWDTWARADQVYRAPGGRWAGQTLEAMQAELHAAYAQAMARATCIAGVLPVGDAALRAMQEGVADRNLYDGVAAGKSSLWADDHYHFGAWGSYLEALVIFGQLAGRDPASLGATNRAGRDLGLSAAQIEAAQGVASRQLRTPHDSGVRPPSSPASPTRP
ncbi:MULTISPECIES: hypothetical protein [unclassified Roseateles]|uniref:hypothetical protein n=1 Tax=unclassified Roseateles TaxID=2626991 RepID=UPI0006F60D13|nr:MULTISPECIES: hypothetical protein [unclassified Roseateles]KQW46389.1 hypothetical protein ASC81_08245 [Pelomonas sp. Root405]KRA73439.1 hypothetical protein ASD88_08245 [Pelomonas sp. Root662]